MTDIARAALPIDLGGGPFAVTTRGLAKRFGAVRALDGLDLQVPEGAVYVLVGPERCGQEHADPDPHGTCALPGRSGQRSGAGSGRPGG